MPISLNNKVYKMILLDTNIISNMAKNKKNEVVNFLSKFSPSEYVVCLTIYNIIEIRNSRKNGRDDLFNKIIKLLSMFPVVLLKHHKYIIQYEVETVIMNRDFDSKEIIMLSLLPGKDFKNFYDNVVEELSELIEHEESQLDEVIESWENQRLFYSECEKNVDSNELKDEDRKIMRYALNFSEPYEQILINNMLNEPYYELNLNSPVMNWKRLKGTRVHIMSHYERVRHTKKPFGLNDLYDISINVAVPYMDAFITEKYQGSILKKKKKKIQGLKELEIYKVSDIQSKDHI